MDYMTVGREYWGRESLSEEDDKKVVRKWGETSTLRVILKATWESIL